MVAEVGAVAEPVAPLAPRSGANAEAEPVVGAVAEEEATAKAEVLGPASALWWRGLFGVDGGGDSARASI